MGCGTLQMKIDGFLRARGTHANGVTAMWYVTAKGFSALKDFLKALFKANVNEALFIVKRKLDTTKNPISLEFQESV